MATDGQESITQCPICATNSFAPTPQTCDVVEVLQRWEREAGVTFPGSVWAEYSDAPRVTLHRCSNCYFAFFEPAFPGSTDFYKGITTLDGSCYTPEKWEFQQAIDDIRRNGCRRVLDIGAGSGLFLDLLTQRLPHVECLGFEFNQDMTALGCGKGHNVRHGPSPEILLEEGAGSFDAVCIFQVLEHVADPVRLLTIAKELLSPGGLLVVSVPDNAGPVRHFSRALTELPPHHLSRWRASTFRIGLPRLGFDVIRIRHEPLPAYLWKDYLPVMLEDSFLPKRLVRAITMNDRLARMLSALGLKSLHGVRGHSVYVAAQLAGSG